MGQFILSEHLLDLYHQSELRHSFQLFLLRLIFHVCLIKDLPKHIQFYMHQEPLYHNCLSHSSNNCKFLSYGNNLSYWSS